MARPSLCQFFEEWLPGNGITERMELGAIPTGDLFNVFKADARSTS